MDKIKIWFQNRRARKRREELSEIRKEKLYSSIADEKSLIIHGDIQSQSDESLVKANPEDKATISSNCFSNSSAVSFNI